MREMPHGQWLAFDADDSVHTHGPSGYDNMSSTVSHGILPPTPPFVPKPAPKPTVSRPLAPPIGESKKLARASDKERDTLLGWIIAFFIICLIVILASKK